MSGPSALIYLLCRTCVYYVASHRYYVASHTHTTQTTDHAQTRAYLQTGSMQCGKECSIQSTKPFHLTTPSKPSLHPAPPSHLLKQAVGTRHEDMETWSRDTTLDKTRQATVDVRPGDRHKRRKGRGHSQDT
mmetsp:Transcript_18488/g.15118  ORF Transcript_18488/g.15118 Transcript_18488/m.15118 type:complete len:132 (+) Transcript_18488:115-510(+)